MSEDDGAGRRPLPEVLRRVLERLDRFAPLPPASPGPRSLGAGSPGAAVLAVGEPEPSTDVIEGPRTIFVTVDLPEVGREDIDLRATESTLVVIANSAARKYYREIPLPAPVRVDAIRAKYRNGVLDVVLEKRDPPWQIDPN